jgi:hypothetical protein
VAAGRGGSGLAAIAVVSASRAELVGDSVGKCGQGGG